MADPGCTVCKFHGAGLQRRSPVRINHLPKFYRDVLSGTLRDYVAESLAMPLSDQVSLAEEVALMRSRSAQAVKLYDIALSQPPSDKMLQTVLQAGSVMAETLKDVESLCLSQAKIQAMSPDAVSVHAVNAIVNQLVRLAHDVLEEAQAVAFEEAVRKNVRIQRARAGTLITPDQDAVDMDNTVPGGPG